MKKSEKLKLETDVEYFNQNLNDAIEHLNSKIKLNNAPEDIHKFLDIVLRISSQLKMAEDVLVIYRVTNR